MQEIANTNSDQPKKAETNRIASPPTAPLALLKTRHLHRCLILFALLGICTLVYYFGELVDFAGWKALRWEFFYGTHDVQRLFFVVPIAYAAYFFGIRGAAIVTIASLIAVLPRAIIISPFPEPILRAVLSIMIAGVVGCIVAVMRNRLEWRSRVGSPVTNGSDRPPETLKRIGDEIFSAGDLEVDLSMRLVKRRGQIVKLTPTEYKLLTYFVSNAGKLMTQSELLHHVWGPEYAAESGYLRNYIRQLRQKVEDDPSNPQFIVTVSGIGYRFVEPEYHRR
jgi:DNA-binding winged helix-turn-helix (wHTH) protein